MELGSVAVSTPSRHVSNREQLEELIAEVTQLR
jgi:hypothetical protein